MDLEYRWRANRWPKRVEEYQREFPELADGGRVPCDIVYEEFHIRKQQGEPVSAAEYCDRFPAAETELRRLFQLESATHSAALIPASRADVRGRTTHRRFRSAVSLGQGGFRHRVSCPPMLDAATRGASRSRAIVAPSRRRWRSSTIPISFACSISGNCPTPGCGSCTCNTCRAERSRARSSMSVRAPRDAHGASLLEAIDRALPQTASERRATR